MVMVLVIPGLLVGLVIAVFQAATQINEQTLSFLPRLIMTLTHGDFCRTLDVKTLSWNYLITVFHLIPGMIG